MKTFVRRAAQVIGLSAAFVLGAAGVASASPSTTQVHVERGNGGGSHGHGGHGGHSGHGNGHGHGGHRGHGRVFGHYGRYAFGHQFGRGFGARYAWSAPVVYGAPVLTGGVTLCVLPDGSTFECVPIN